MEGSVAHINLIEMEVYHLFQVVCLQSHGRINENYRYFSDALENVKNVSIFSGNKKKSSGDFYSCDTIDT